MEPKTDLREKALADRRRMSPKERSKKSRAVAEMFLGLGLLRPEATVGFYLAAWDEVETRPLVQRAIETGCAVVLPRVSVNGDLELYQVRDLSSELEVGSFGLEEPVRVSNASMPVEMVECFVVPGVAFDTSGRRLGFGLGYFDRLLARRTEDSLVVALAFECQITPAVPAHEHDISMDIICTEERVIDCRGQSLKPQVVSQPADGREVQIP